MAEVLPSSDGFLKGL